MTLAQQSALEAVLARPLKPEEVAAIDAVLPIRNDVEIAAILSVGRVTIVSHEIGERGILDVLGSEDGETFLVALEGITDPAALPESLRPHYGAIRRGVSWLKSDGLDVGSPTTRKLLDALAAAGILDAGAVAKVKKVAERDHPFHYNVVSDALNVAEGRLTMSGG